MHRIFAGYRVALSVQICRFWKLEARVAQSFLWRSAWRVVEAEASPSREVCA
jgi:hypothetical protein